jgi:hypothetical protein
VLVEEMNFKVGGFFLHLRASFRVPPPYHMYTIHTPLHHMTIYHV